MPNLPTDIEFGHVVMVAALAVGDTADVGSDPDATPVSGEVVLTPVAKQILSTATPPTMILPQAVTCTFDGTGHLTDPQGNEGCWLVVGQYDVTFSLTTGSLAGFRIEVLATHTEEDPLDLTVAAPLVVPPGFVPVVNNELYLDTVEARDAALAAQAAAEAAAGGMIAKSLVDAKGDLLVGTANDTVGRLAVGADGTFLRADSAAPGGLSFGTPSGGGGNAFPRKSGQYFSTTHPLNTVNADANVFGTSGQRLYLIPFEVTHPQALDRLAANVAAAGPAGSLLWLGLYTHNDAFGMINRVVHASTAADVTGDRVVTVATGTLTSAMYWLAIGHNGLTNALIVRRGSAFGGRQGALGGGVQFSTEWAPRFDVNFATGPGLPATLNLSAAANWEVNDVPLVWARKA